MATLIPEPLQKLRAFYVARAPHTERNTTQNTRTNIARHYDLSNDMFATFLDGTLSYSSALFAGDEHPGGGRGGGRDHQRPDGARPGTTSPTRSAARSTGMLDSRRRR